MPAEINYKNKYLELRSKYMSDVDTAFRLGFEAGAQQSQQQQALDAQSQNQEMEHQQNLAEVGGVQQLGNQEGQKPPQAGEQPGGENPNGSELDQHIGKLESMLSSSSEPEVKKSLEAIISLRKVEKFQADMKKSEQAISGIAKALHKPAFKLGTQAQHNMTDNAKKSVSLQHKIVNDLMKAWKAEEEKASNSIESILNVENLLNKE